MKRLAYQDRDECAGWMVNVWRDAYAFKQDHPTLLACLQRVRESRKYQRLPQYMRQYVEGFARCFEVNTVQRSLQEHGSWVIMPDGSERWFGTAERLSSQAVYGLGIDYKYINDHSIPERSGIYWLADTTRGTAPGQCPHFIPALHFDVVAFQARMAAKAEVTA